MNNPFVALGGMPDIRGADLMPHESLEHFDLVAGEVGAINRIVEHPAWKNV